MRYCLLLASLFSVQAVANDVMFSSGDDQDQFDAANVKIVDPPAHLIDFVLKAEPESQKQFAECLLTHGLSETDAKTLFTVFELRLNDDASPDYFVRPAEGPFCAAFYGAHVFRYWFIATQRQGPEISYSMVLRGGGDGVSVLNSMTHGFHDLLLRSHTAVELFKTTLKFDGHDYRETDCTVDRFKNGVVVGASRC